MSLTDIARQLWTVIKNERNEKKNTAERVGSAGMAILDALENATPYIGANGNWWIGGADTGKTSKGDTGVSVSGVQVDAVGDLIITFSDNTQHNAGYVKGEKGDTGSQGAKGDTGNDGKSAYQYAIDGGYTGTEEEFYQALSGIINTTYATTEANNYLPLTLENPILRVNVNGGTGTLAFNFPSVLPKENASLRMIVNNSRSALVNIAMPNGDIIRDDIIYHLINCSDDSTITVAPAKSVEFHLAFDKLEEGDFEIRIANLREL
ncbi:hypothetical protein D0T49_00420 [Paludibacter sp. 221]|uniref:hypothetical protein n=1 Tax=Paludibacter sp. 221 TaxID=2302939 RepID=UPI0013D82E11|nr:hypothetical protein [Paludibacter sp. 221]NDV45517.1 hypothetical protein [Paludibacter sp. 221]